MDVPAVATPTLVVWETEDAFRAAVQVHGQNGLAGVWGAAEQPKWRQLLTLHPHNGFLLTKEEQYDRAALARCVRPATRNAYLTLESQLAGSRTYEPGNYFELWVSPWGHVRCTCLGFTCRGVCKHAEALRDRLDKNA